MPSAWVQRARSLARTAGEGLASRLGVTPEDLAFYLLVPLVGAVTGLVGMGICEAIDLVQHIVWHSDEHLLDAAFSAPRWLCVLAPALGGAFVAFLVWVTRQKVRGHGTSAILEAVAVKGGKIEAGPVILREIAGIATVGSGGSLGREGPLIRTGAMIGSVMGQRLGALSGKRLKLLVGCGAAAGMAAAYNAPIGGALFALEVVLANFSLEVAGPVVLASVIGTFLARAFHGSHPAYDIPHYQLVSVWELPVYLLLGVLLGPLSIGFSRGVRGGERVFDRIDWIPEGIKPIVGMTLLGVVGMFLPYVYGNGFDTVDRALHEDLSLWLLLALPFIKVAMTGLTLGSGCTGGLFTPALFVGGLLGGLYGAAVHAIMPDHSATSGAYVLGGMVAITAGTSHAPISSILIIFEMTGDYNAMLPLMLAAMGSAGIARWVTPHSIYTESLARKGISFHGNLEDFAPGAVLVREVAQPEPERLRRRDTLPTILERFSRGRRTHVFVSDPDWRYVGAVALHELAPVLSDLPRFAAITAMDLADTSFPTIRPTDTLSQALDLFVRTHAESLPVTDEKGILVGVVAKDDVLSVYSHGVIGKPGTLSPAPQDGGAIPLVPLPNGVRLREIAAPPHVEGQALGELQLPQRYGVMILARVRTEGGVQRREIAGAATRLANGDRLVAVGTHEALEKFHAAVRIEPPPSSVEAESRREPTTPAERS